jgi:hypothetical protein
MRSKRLSAVLRSQPPKRVPFGAIIGDASVPPDNLRNPIPHGLLMGISAIPSPSKSLCLPIIFASADTYE